MHDKFYCSSIDQLSHTLIPFAQSLELDEIPVDTVLFEQLAGKIPNIDALFPLWDENAMTEEKWSEPLAADAVKTVKYPQNLGVTSEVNFMTFFGLEPIEAVVDPKAKKEAKKDPKKGSVEAPVALTELLVDENGRTLPVVFKEKNNTLNADATASASVKANSATDGTTKESRLEFQGFDLPRPFKRTYTEQQQRQMERDGATTANGGATTSEVQPQGEEVDPFLCSAFRVVQRFTPVIVSAHLSTLAVVYEAVEGAEQGERRAVA